jgi:nicotinate-nucleotide adenylyltransferase
LRFGLLGGTFDPVHSGHLEIAETAIRVASLDAVYFVTSVHPPHKSEKTQANFLDRHAMVALALSGNPKLIPSSLEYDRMGKSYSIDTVRRFKESSGPSSQFFFLIGMDAFLELSTWKDYQRFPDLCSFLVFARPGFDQGELARILPEDFQAQGLGRSTREALANTGDTGIFVLTDFSNPISSTEIRERVRTGQPIRDWVPTQVEEYISKTRLYLNY